MLARLLIALALGLIAYIVADHFLGYALSVLIGIVVGVVTYKYGI